MEKSVIKNCTQDILYKFSLITALTLSVGVCSGFNTFTVFAAGIFACIVGKFDSTTDLLPVFTTYIISDYLVGKSGEFFVICSYVIAGLLILALPNIRFIKNLCTNKIIKPALALPVAMTITCLATNIYFGIGVSGNTFGEMIADYISHGFHPNWRGILYGTIVMVIAITFRRKFKKAAKYVSGFFLAIIGAYLLNIFLIPEGTKLSLELVATPELTISSLKSISVPSDFTASDIIFTILGAISIAFTYCIFRKEDSKDDSITGLSVIVSGAMFGYVLPCEIRKKGKDVICGLIAAVLSSALLFATGFFERLPAASCAVVLIVGAWQSAEGRGVGAQFRKPAAAVALLLTFAVTLLTNPVIGITAGSVICLTAETKIRN